MPKQRQLLDYNLELVRVKKHLKALDSQKKDQISYLGLKPLQNQNASSKVFVNFRVLFYALQLGCSQFWRLFALTKKVSRLGQANYIAYFGRFPTVKSILSRKKAKNSQKKAKKGGFSTEFLERLKTFFRFFCIFQTRGAFRKL